MTLKVMICLQSQSAGTSLEQFAIMDRHGLFLRSTSFYPGYFFDRQQQQFGPFMNELHLQLNVGEGSQSRPGSASFNTNSPMSSIAVASTSSASSPESEPAKKTVYDKWPHNDQKMLICLWADNFNRLESREAQKVWDEITRALNSKFGTKRTSDKVQKKMKYWIKRYKGAEDWNSKQTGGNLKQSVHYNEIDEVLGCRDTVTLNRVGKAGSSNHAGEEAASAKDLVCTDNTKQRTARKKRAREDNKQDEEWKFFKNALSGLEAQRGEMSTPIDGSNRNHEQQLATMNALVGALTNFLQKQ